MGKHVEEKTKDDARKKPRGRPALNPYAAVPSSIRVNAENPKSVWVKFRDDTPDLRLHAHDITTSQDRCYIIVKRGIVTRTITIPLSHIFSMVKDELPMLQAASQSVQQPQPALVPIDDAVPLHRETNLVPRIRQQMQEAKKFAAKRGRDFYKPGKDEGGELLSPEPTVNIDLREAVSAK